MECLSLVAGLVHTTGGHESTHAMHDHTAQAVATLGTDAPRIKAVTTLEAEAILTKTVATLQEHVGTLDMMQVAVAEKSDGATTLHDDDDEGEVPTTEGGDKLGRDSDCDKVANVLWLLCALPILSTPILRATWLRGSSCTPLSLSHTHPGQPEPPPAHTNTI